MAVSTCKSCGLQRVGSKSSMRLVACVPLQLLVPLLLVGLISGKALAAAAPGQKVDLSGLINETLVINNKTASGEQATSAAGLRDDWTFERIEYDLLDFLQELNARYKNSSGQQVGALPSELDGSQPTGQPEAKLTAKSETRAPASLAPGASGTAGGSLEQDLAESKWQYGIFDRFTRARSTTQVPKHEQGGLAEPSSASSSLDYDLRSFNSDECGLRTYLSDSESSALDSSLPAFFPQPAELEPLSGGDLGAESAAHENEARRELNERRQRPPAHLAKRRPTETLVSGSGGECQPGEADEKLETDSADSSAASSEQFNLNSRRQWLQQQLGNTLQLLGFNLSTSTQPIAGERWKNETQWSALSARESMMKMQGPLAAKQQLATRSADEHRLLRHLDELNARQDELKLEARVIGGTDARLGDSPWSVSLQALVARPGTAGVEYRHYCGGTIISEYYILTAAHCLDFMVGRESRLFVVMGDLNWRMSTGSVYGRRVAVERLIIHSGYKSTAFGHDIGLIKTREPIKPLRSNGRYIVNSVCLPERNLEHSGEAELVGWGLFSNRNEMADSLQIADVPILPRPLCVDLYRRRTGLIQWLIGIELITDKQICAGTFGRGICQGDSGSALVFNEKSTRQPVASAAAAAALSNKARLTARLAAPNRLKSNSARDQQSRATIIGVVAFGGIRRCSYQSLPGVYMQTSKYLDWILPKISA